MSDYMFMLENHLSADQNRVVTDVLAAATHAGVNLFLAGGAMRDMLGGFPVRDLDFTVEGNALKLAKVLAAKAHVKILNEDEDRKSAELIFPGGVTAQVAMARQERYGKPGTRPHIRQASIYDDLRGRDFTFNAIALSLNPASRGLLLDPTNGLADLQRREIRAVHNYVFYDDPVRMLRFIRLRVRMGFTVDERTQLQFENAREAGVEAYIAPRSLHDELCQLADEPNSADVVKAFDEAHFLALFSPAMTGAKLNLPGLVKLQKARHMAPFGTEPRVDNRGLFLTVFAEKLSPKERATLIKTTHLRKADVDLWQTLPQRAKPLERELKSSRLRKASQIYDAILKAPGDQVFYLMLYSSQRLVQDRIRNYLQKYLAAAQEITDREVAATGVAPGDPKFAKAKQDMISARLDGRLKKAPPPEVAPAPVPSAGPHRGRGRPAARQS
jgi:tRNA nucleotidyltransferase/poly(A) polymerase